MIPKQNLLFFISFFFSIIKCILYIYIFINILRVLKIINSYLDFYLYNYFLYLKVFFCLIEVYIFKTFYLV